MGVYNSFELEKFSTHSLTKMKNVHLNDLREYRWSKPYPNQKRDILDTEQNIDIIDKVLESKSERNMTFTYKGESFLKNSSIVLYGLAAGYILLALASLKFDVPSNYTAAAAVIAFFLSVFDFFNITKEFTKNNIGRKIQSILASSTLIFIVILTICLSYLFDEFLDKEYVDVISNYVTYAAIGVVFITKGMENRHKKD